MQCTSDVKVVLATYIKGLDEIDLKYNHSERE